MIIPPLVWGVLGWHRRWITDDGLIVARTVREILAGNGPVFNRGERVEASTSTLWTWLLAAVTWVTRLDVYTIMVWTGLLLAPLGLLFALLGARELHRRHAPGRLLVPVGALVVLALRPFWDFATSGLEDSLIFCWLGMCWWLLAGVDPGARRRTAWLAFVAGLGWLVRPDMALGTAGFLAAGLYLGRPGWRRGARLLGIAVIAPGAYQVFRMGYYGLLVPNTAVAKDASSTHLRQGMIYLENFLTPYRLWIPVLVLLVLVAGRHMDRGDLVRCAAAAGSGLLMAAYVIAIGGDFMHARMLLPATFALLLPVMMLPVPKPPVRAAVPAGLCVAILCGWAMACGAHWRAGGDEPWVVPKSGIVDERAYWVHRTGHPYPVTAADYVLSLMGSPSMAGSLEWRIARYASPGRPALLYAQHFEVPLSRPGYPVAVTATLLGTWGAGVPLNDLVVDQRGLSYAVASHLIGIPDGRPGHTKLIPPAWIVAEYSNVTRAPGIPSAEIAAARKALSCGRLAELNHATQAPLTLGQFVSNFFHSFALTTFRFSANPSVASPQLCGGGR